MIKENHRFEEAHKMQIDAIRQMAEGYSPTKINFSIDRIQKRLHIDLAISDGVSEKIKLSVHLEDVMQVLMYMKCYKPYFALLDQRTREKLYDLNKSDGIDLQIDFLANEAINDKITVLKKYINEKDLN